MYTSVQTSLSHSAPELLEALNNLSSSVCLYPVWLKNNGNDVIGIMPKWLLCTKLQGDHSFLTSTSTRENFDKHNIVHYSAAVTSQTNVFDCVDNYIKSYSHTGFEDVCPSAQSVDFHAGLIGFVGYDYAAHCTGSICPSVLAQQVQTYNTQVFFGHYDIYFKKLHGTWVLFFDSSDHELISVADNLVSQLQSYASSNLVFSCDEVFHHCSKPQYKKLFDQVQNYLKAGDCYQVNLAQQFSTSFEGNPLALLEQLDSHTNAPYAGYVQTPDFQLISCSPELFLDFIHNPVTTETQIVTKPIKGTLPRLPNKERDNQQIQKLQNCEKNLAENVMIVDLLRNDMSVYAKTGSVNVPKLFEIESYTQVHHMVSTITATLNNNHTSLDVLKSALPGGSITGAPKIRSMQIIQELEQHPRGAYCGSLGFINFDGSGSFNILIRTIQFSKHKLSVWAGGGITIASECDAEYQECFDKVSGILEVLKKFSK